MNTRIEEYSVGQLARLAGVSVRTLHHYDDIGLLRPAHVAANGYRLYWRPELLRLQEIMFYRDVGLSLTEIGDLLDGPTDAMDRLLRHRERLREQNRRTLEIIDTLDATIAHLKGERDMALAEMYKPFSSEKQAEYETWLIAEYGADMAARIATSKAAVDALPGGMDGAMTQLEAAETSLVDLYENKVPPESDQCHETLDRHRAFVAQMWGRACSADEYEGLAAMYRSQPDFVARYETLSPQFSRWLPVAMTAHAERLRRK